MADETDNETVAAHNGATVPRRVKPSKADTREATKAPQEKPKASAPSPIDEPGKASSARRTEATEVHRALEADDGERMYAVEVLEGETREALLFVVDMMLKVQGKVIATDKLDAILNHETNAGFCVVKTDHGNAVRPRKLTRVQAIAYGLGGAGVSAYERLAAIQITRAALFAVGLILTQVVSVAIDANAEAVDRPKPPVDAVDSEPGAMVDARNIVDDNTPTEGTE